MDFAWPDDRVNCQHFYGQKATPQEISLSTFMENLDSGNIEMLRIIGDDKVQGRLANGQEFETYVPDISSSPTS